jgi:hypothetical protein
MLSNRFENALNDARGLPLLVVINKPNGISSMISTSLILPIVIGMNHSN